MKSYQQQKVSLNAAAYKRYINCAATWTENIYKYNVMGDKTTALIYIKEVFYTFKQLFPKLFQCNRHMPN